MKLPAIATALLITISATAQGPWATITGDGVRLRSGPSTEANIIETLPKGERMMVERILPGQPWAKLYGATNHSPGWVNTDFLKLESPPTPKDAGPPRFADVLGSISLRDGIRITEHFPENESVRLLAEGLTRVYRGTATMQLTERNECAGTDIPYTQVNLAPGQDTTVDPIVAIIDGGELTLLHLVDVPDKAVIAELEERANRHPRKNPDFELKPNRSKAYELPDKSVRVLVQTQDNDPAIYPIMQRCTLTIDEHTEVLYESCGTLPEFFKLDGVLHCILRHNACESDDYNMVVYQLTESGVKEVYRSLWFGC